MRALPPSLARAIERQGEGLTVLAVRLGALGDILRTLPAVRLVRRALPQSRLLWVVDDRWSGVLRGHRDLDGLLELPRRGPVSTSNLLAFRRSLREVQADLALDFHGNLRSGLVARLAGAPVRLGYSRPQARELNAWLSTHRVPGRDRRTPRIEQNLDLLRGLGIATAPLPVAELPLATAGQERANEIVRGLLGGGPYAVISPGASQAQAYKKPPAAVLAAAIPPLASVGAKSLVVWGPGEEEDARRVVELGAGAAVLAPPTDLAALAALISHARLYVGGDSGPLHLACCLGCAVIAVYGPTDPVINGPWGVEARSVFPPGRVYTGIKRLDRRDGFDGLQPEQVAAAVEGITGASRAGARRYDNG